MFDAENEEPKPNAGVAVSVFVFVFVLVVVGLLFVALKFENVIGVAFVVVGAELNAGVGMADAVVAPDDGLLVALLLINPNWTGLVSVVVADFCGLINENNLDLVFVLFFCIAIELELAIILGFISTYSGTFPEKTG